MTLHIESSSLYACLERRLWLDSLLHPKRRANATAQSSLEKMWDNNCWRFCIVKILGYFGLFSHDSMSRENRYLLKVFLAAWKKPITKRWYEAEALTQDEWLKMLNEMYVGHQNWRNGPCLHVNKKMRDGTIKYATAAHLSRPFHVSFLFTFFLFPRMELLC